MSMPEPHHPIDPFSHALGRIEGRLEAIELQVVRVENVMATKAELRAWSSIIVLLVGALLALVLRGHGG